jgi:hypothetical protein
MQTSKRFIRLIVVGILFMMMLRVFVSVEIGDDTVSPTPSPTPPALVTHNTVSGGHIIV